MLATNISTYPKKDFADYIFDVAFNKLIQDGISMEETYKAVSEKGFHELLDKDFVEDIEEKVIEFLTICIEEFGEYLSTCTELPKDVNFIFLVLAEGFIKWQFEKGI